jgi:hypothetical protein
MIAALSVVLAARGRVSAPGIFKDTAAGSGQNARDFHIGPRQPYLAHGIDRLSEVFGSRRLFDLQSTLEKYFAAAITIQGPNIGDR